MQLLPENRILPIHKLIACFNNTSATYKFYWLLSIIQQVGTQQFPRMRVGIGRPPGRMDAADYVLQDFVGEEKEIFTQVIDRAVKAIRLFVLEGLARAMNECNGKVEP